MKIFRQFLVVVIILLAFEALVAADTGTDAIVNGIGHYIALAAGFIANRVIERIKQVFPFLTDEEQTTIKRAVIEGLSLVISIAVALAIGYGAKLLGFATPIDLISAVLLAYPVAYTTFLATRMSA